MLEVCIGKERATLTGLIGKGGEGKIYSIKDRSGQAAKIYKPGLRAAREDKVRAIVDEGLAATTNLVTYPSEIVTDRKGYFLGFAMRLVSGNLPLHELYNPKSRLRRFPKKDFRFLVRAAQNVACAVGNVHQTGCVIGDLNQSGLLVAQDATVAVIDADSFQYSLNGRSYRCKVGVPDFTPPELQGKDLKSVQRTIAHDNFGLAVAIFHLLFMGCHPYAGRYHGPDISIGEAIAQNRFAFSLARRNETGTSPPPEALTLDLFPDAIIQLFEKAFGTTYGARPNAQHWIQALRRLAGDLRCCSKYRSHYYPSTAETCVWCRDFDMFPGRKTDQQNIPTGRDTEQDIDDILTFRLPRAEEILPTRPKPPNASRELDKAIKGKWWNPSKRQKVQEKPFIKAFNDADKLVQLALDEFIRRNNVTEAATKVKEIRRDVKGAYASYNHNIRVLDRELKRELQEFESNRKNRQRDTYLDDFSIRSADIPGIGIVSAYTLLLFGIQTASDIERSDVIRVPGIDDEMADKLMNWRRTHERKFRYDPTPNDQDIADKQTLMDQFAKKKAEKKVELDSRVRNNVDAFLRARTLLDALPAKARRNAALTRALDCRAQAARDLEELKVSVPDSTVRLNFDPPDLDSFSWWWILLAPVAIPVVVLDYLINGRDK